MDHADLEHKGSEVILTCMCIKICSDAVICNYLLNTTQATELTFLRPLNSEACKHKLNSLETEKERTWHAGWKFTYLFLLKQIGHWEYSMAFVISQLGNQGSYSTKNPD